MSESEQKAGAARVLYEDDVPLSVVARVQPLLEKWAWLIPANCHEIAVTYLPMPADGDAPGSVAAVELSPEYRRVELYVYGEWMRETKASRERYIVHELCHVVNAPMATLLDYLIEQRCADNPQLKTWATEQARRATEEVVCDMTQALLSRKRRRAAVAL